MWSRRSTSIRSRRAALAAALACLAVPPAAAQGVRPAVLLDVQIDGALYRSRLGDPACTARCAALRGALVDSVRATMERSFGFLDWRTTPASAPDTVRLAWTNNERTQTGELQLTVLGRDRAARQRPVRIPFESFSAIATRDSRDWRSPTIVRNAWLARLRAILARPSDAELVTRRVLAHVPMQPLVKLDRSAEVLVGVAPGAIRADPLRNPAFLVRMQVVDPANVPPAQARHDATEMSLTGCSRTEDGLRYVCRVEFLAYPQRTPPDTLKEAVQLRRLAARARQQPVTLHVWSYFPADPAADAPIRPPQE